MHFFVLAMISAQCPECRLVIACECTSVSTGGRAHSPSFFAVRTKESNTCASLCANAWICACQAGSLSLPHNFAVQSAIGKMNSSLFFWCQYFFRVDSSRIKFWCVQLTQIFQICNHNISFTNATPRSAHSQERFLVILSCQIDEFSPDLSVMSDDIQPLPQKGLLVH